MSLQDIRETMDNYLGLMNVQIMAISPKASDIALNAFERYGKGRHPATLNYHDLTRVSFAGHWLSVLKC
jgi:ribonuclease VapC